MKKFVRYTTVIAIILVIAIGIYYIACTVRTPEITGTVIDKETKKPVENAWIMAVVETNTRTFGGDVSVHYLITPPHTRTDKEGRFSIPSRTYYSSPPPLGWGMSKTRLRIDVYGPEGKRGAIDLYTYKQAHQPVPQDKEAIVKPTPSLKERKLAVTIPVSYVTMNLEDTKEELGWLAGYCGSGRYRFARPIVPNACDRKEIGYVVEESEKLKERLENPKTVQEEAAYSNQLLLLAVLYEKQSDYEKSLFYYQKAYDFDRQSGSPLRLDRYTTEIVRLKKILKDK